MFLHVAVQQVEITVGCKLCQLRLILVPNVNLRCKESESSQSILLNGEFEIKADQEDFYAVNQMIMTHEGLKK